MIADWAVCLRTDEPARIPLVCLDFYTKLSLIHPHIGATCSLMTIAKALFFGFSPSLQGTTFYFAPISSRSIFSVSLVNHICCLCRSRSRFDNR